MLGEIASPKLDAAIAQLVAKKHACDALARRNDPLAAIAGHGLDFWRDSYFTPDGFSFFSKVFPFMQWSDKGKGISALVPARRTIGDAHRRYPERMTPEDERTKLAYLQHPDRAVWGNEECATYTWIRPLGLFLAGEGKNRVSLFQRLGVEWIPACVSTESYPSPERIVLYVIQEAGLEYWWAVLDGRMVEPMPNPMWALPVLKAYGVKVELRWPKKFPPLTVVRSALQDVEEDGIRRKRQVDLDVVLAREEWGDKQVWISPWSQLSLKAACKWICGWIVIVSAGVLLMAAPPGLGWVGAIGAGLLGAATGTWVLSQARFLPMRQRDVRPWLSYNAWEKRLRSKQ
jgi:hypothetical protein